MKKRLLPFLTLILISSMGFAQTHTMLVTVPDSVVVCYAAGSFNGWNPSANLMTQISDSPKMFSLEFEMEGSADSVEYKFLAGPDWKYQQKASANFLFVDDSATAVVDTFLAIYRLDQEKDVTIDVLVPVEVYQLNLTGNFNNWDPTANPMEKVDSSANGKEFMLTIHTLDTTTLEFKFIAGPGWPYEQTQSSNYNYMNDGGTVVCENFKKIFDPSKVGDITINITSVPEGTPAVWIIGSFADWTLDGAIEATDNGDGTYTAVIPMVADIEYKCWNYPDWIYEEASDTLGTQVPNRIASFETGPVFDITVEYWAEVFGSPTVIKDPISAAYKMYTTYGTIVVEGVNSNVTIFDLYGHMIQNVRAKGTFVSRNLRTGLYIIRIDNKAQKIVVR